MKMGERRDWHSSSRTLQIVGDRREKLEYAQAEWLAHADEPFLLPFAYEQDAVPPRLFYDVTGLARLRAYLKAKVTGSQYLGMLATVRDAMALCTKRGYPTSCMCFDPEHAYVADGGQLRLAFVPLSGGPELPEKAPRALLEYLASSDHVRFVVDADERSQRALDDFVRRTPVLSLSTYQAFLGSSLGVQPVEDAVCASPAMSYTSASEAGPTRSAISGAWHAGTSSGSSSVVSFDMVGMLSHRASASEIEAGQGLAERAINGVAGISPTAAGTSSSASAPATSAPAPAVSAASAPAPAATVAHARKTILLGGGTGFATPTSAGVGVAEVSTCFLLVRERDGESIVVDLTYPVTIGRSQAADVQIEGNGSLSRLHARLSCDGDGFSIQDLGSLNGVFVCGSRLPREGSAHVAVGERFRLADEVFCLLQEKKESRND